MHHLTQKLETCFWFSADVIGDGIKPDVELGGTPGY